MGPVRFSSVLDFLFRLHCYHRIAEKGPIYSNQIRNIFLAAQLLVFNERSYLQSSFLASLFSPHRRFLSTCFYGNFFFKYTGTETRLEIETSVCYQNLLNTSIKDELPMCFSCHSAADSFQHCGGTFWLLL